MARTKGSAFVALKSFVTRRFGYEGWKRYLGRIEPRERKDIEMPSAKEWYDLEVWVRSLQVLKDVFGEELPEVVNEFGRHEAVRVGGGQERPTRAHPLPLARRRQLCLERQLGLIG